MNYKTMIAPIVAIIALAIKGLFKVEVPEELQNTVTDWISTGILIGVGIYGVAKTHKKKGDETK